MLTTSARVGEELQAIFPHTGASGACLVLVQRQALLGLARDSRNREAPAEPERAVARARVVGEDELRAKAGPPGRCVDRDAHGRGARHRVRAELLAKASNRSAALGQADLWGRNAEILRCGRKAVRGGRYPCVGRMLERRARSRGDDQASMSLAHGCLLEPDPHVHIWLQARPPRSRTAADLPPAGASRR
jgi:hypothetical protein